MKAIVVGSANTDLTIHVDSLPSLGSTEVGFGFKSGAGGKGANQAVCLSKLKAETYFIARFGKDDFSSVLLEHIARYGINLSYAVIDEKHRGGVVFIVVDRTGNNTMIADLGSNMFLDGADVEHARDAFTGADLLLLQFEVSHSANLRACEIASARKTKIVLNPAPVKKFDTSYLKYVDVLTHNLFELSQILYHIEGRVVVSRDEEDAARVGAAAQRLTAHGVRHILVTMGARGSIHADVEKIERFGTYRVKQVDSTGAGDAFTAAFACKFAEGLDVPDAVKYASACAALTVMREGAIPSIPDGDEVKDFMAKHRFGGFQ